jgi:two-component system, chemotaxis family, response regulator Rcp1
MRRSRPVRVLLVEDNAGDAQLMRIAFAEAHPDALLRLATDGEAALKALVSPAPGDEPDLVLLDLNLPRLTGHEVLAAMRESDQPAAHRTSVVVMTTSSALGDVQRSYELGARSHITKPLEIDEFFTTVASLARYWFETVELPAGDL